MSDDIKYLESGVITRADTTPNGGLVLAVSTDHGHYVVEAEACQCGKPCDLTHITVTNIRGYP